MIIDTMMSYSEVYEILNLLEEEYREKVPKNIIKFFEEERLKDYKPQIVIDVPLIEQNLKRETIVLLAVLNLNYWCATPEEKQEVLDELTKNEKEKQEFLDKYNPDNLFKKRQENKQEYSAQKEISVIEYKKPNFIQKLLNKIARFFKR